MSVTRLHETAETRWQGTLEAVLLAAGQCVYELDPRYGALRWWPQGAVVFGHRAAEIPTLGAWLDRVHPEDRLLAHAALVDPPAANAAGADAAPCFRFAAAAGGYRWLECRATRVERGGHTLCAGSLSDVTPRHQADRRLALGALILDTIREAVAVTDPEGTVLWANAAFGVLVGSPGEPLVGRPLQSFCAVPEARRIEQQQEIRDAVARRGAWQGRIDVRRIDGQLAVTEAGVTVLRDQEQDLWVHVRRDVTEKVELEEAAVAAARAEQQRLGLELHDRLGQELAGTSMLVRTLRNAVGAGAAPDPALLRDVEHLLQASVARCRDLAQGVSPFVIDDGGLGAAIEDLVARTRRGTPLAIHAGVCPRTAPLDGNFGYHLFRLAQLALASVLCRDGVTSVELQLWREDDDRVVLAVVADGRREPAPGADARMLSHRLALLGGSAEPLEASHGRNGLIAMVPMPASGAATLTRPALARRA